MVEEVKPLQAQPKSETLWQIGKPDSEFLKEGVWTKEYDYRVGTDSDPINSPRIPTLLTESGVSHEPAKRASTDKLNIHFNLKRSYAEGELTLLYNRYGSEEEKDSLFLDGNLFAKVSGAGEDELQQSQIPLLSVSKGDHTLTITTAGGNGKHLIGYLKLQVKVPKGDAFPRGRIWS